MIGSPILPPLNRTETQQIRAASKPSPGVGVQGVPQAVTNVGVTRRPYSSTQAQLIVSFTHPPNDRYFSSAKIYLSTGTSAPVLISEGNHSPVVVNVDRTKATSVIYVQSVGSWGSYPTQIASCPSQAVSLA